MSDSFRDSIYKMARGPLAGLLFLAPAPGAGAAVKQLPPQAAPLPPGSPVPAPAPELNDIHGVIHIDTVWAWLTPLLTALAVLFGVLLWWRFRKKKSAAEQVRETAAERARKRLRGALNRLEQPERFCTLLSEIVRVYLEERFRIRAPEQTTEEFLADTQKNSVLDQKHRDLLSSFLEQCDLVKFAGYEPVREDLARLHQTASDFVEETAFELPPVAEAIQSATARQ